MCQYSDCMWPHESPLQWRHNGRTGVSNHQPYDSLHNRLFRLTRRKHQSSASLVFVWGIHRWPVNSPHRWPVTRIMFPVDDVIMSLDDTRSRYDLIKGHFSKEYIRSYIVLIRYGCKDTVRTTYHTHRHRYTQTRWEKYTLLEHADAYFVISATNNKQQHR